MPRPSPTGKHTSRPATQRTEGRGKNRGFLVEAWEGILVEAEVAKMEPVRNCTGESHRSLCRTFAGWQPLDGAAGRRQEWRGRPERRLASLL